VEAELEVKEIRLTRKVLFDIKAKGIAASCLRHFYYHGGNGIRNELRVEASEVCPLYFALEGVQ
jgi:hypothetical protein